MWLGLFINGRPTAASFFFSVRARSPMFAPHDEPGYLPGQRDL
jgi:hypothetical protein